MEIRINKDNITRDEAEQLVDSIKAFEEGKVQPAGRFEIIKEIKQEDC